ncbi:MAG: Ig-like domain-containing protein [Prevotellaceae bacterium]|nr:Ig-like domain-containing protein [Candidatus Colivivens equi]
MSWVTDVASSGTFICPKDLPKEYGTGRIPTDWAVSYPAAITLDPEDATLCIGGTLTIKPTIESEDLQGKTITWASDNNEVATVSNDGFVNAIGVGSASITATIENVSATCEITVQNIPASVTDLSVTPDENGAIKANISFTIPSTNKLGENLTGTLTATILRNDAVIYTTDAKNLGDNVTYSDEFNAEAGFYTYSVFVTYIDVNSDNTSVSQFIGFDKLAPAQNFAATDNISGNTETIHFSWDAVEGQNQGYINLDKVTYNIYAVDSKNAQIEPAINVESITDTSFDYTCTDIEQKDQKFVVQAILNEDSSTSESISAILGKAYDLPFIEEFTNANPCFTKYWTDLSSDNLLINYEPVKDENYALKVRAYFSPNTESSSKTAEYLSGKINFTNKDLPKLYYDVKSSNTNNSKNGSLKVEAIDNNGNSYLLEEEFTTTTEYKQHELYLENINADWIRLKFTATVYGGVESGYSYLHLNDITLCNIIRPESVILSQASGTLSMDGTDNQTLNLTATIAPADVDDATVTWSSSNTDVVEVDENGVVTAVGCGKAVIRATANLKGANNTDIFGECYISVTGNTSIKDMDDNDIFVQLSEGETFDINDGEIKNISITKTIEGVNVTYNRLFKNYAWLPWYMPFDVTLTGDLLQDFDFAQFAGAFYYTDNSKEGEMCITVQKMKLGDVVYANTPYMIRAKTPDSEKAQTLEISSVTIVPTQEQVFEQLMRSATLDFNIKGIYNQYVSTADANSTLYYFTSKFTFSRITAADKSVNPFRFYMNIVPRTDNPYTQKVEETPVEIKIRTLDEDNADGIININFTDNDNVNWYDLSGRKVTNKSLPLAKGVYIYNGKKVLCK